MWGVLMISRVVGVSTVSTEFRVSADLSLWIRCGVNKIGGCVDKSTNVRFAAELVCGLGGWWSLVLAPVDASDSTHKVEEFFKDSSVNEALACVLDSIIRIVYGIIWWS